jgi:hypothetical protein
LQIPPNIKVTLPVTVRRELRTKADVARQLAPLQPWHTRRTSRVISVMFAEQACDELVLRIIGALDEQHAVARVDALLSELIQRELVGLADRPGVWCSWACDVLRALKLPVPSFGSAHLVVVRKPEPAPKKNPLLSQERRIPCQWCGKMFPTSKGRAKYCTTDCQLERQNAVRCENDRAKRRAASMPRFCTQCAREIPLWRHNSRYCSSGCRSTSDSLLEKK